MTMTDKLLTTILEEGMSLEIRDTVMHEIADMRRLQAVAKEDEERLKQAWWDAYDRGEVEKRTTLKGVVKLECRDAGSPKEVKVPGHYEIDLEKMLSVYDPQALSVFIQQGILTWIPEQKTTKPGTRATVALTLLDPED